MEEEIGKITHYFSKINVGILEISVFLLMGQGILYMKT